MVFAIPPMRRARRPKFPTMIETGSDVSGEVSIPIHARRRKAMPVFAHAENWLVTGLYGCCGSNVLLLIVAIRTIVHMRKGINEQKNSTEGRNGESAVRAA